MARPLAAQQPALVLSGGGARGLAHGGVLTGLERLGYDPPIVVGTSMGAVIGALYAAGYPAAEIWDVVARQNWADTFAPDPFPVGPDRQPRRPMISVGLSHGAGAALEGFVAQAAINRRLVELLFDAGARANNDFDALPRRFRAIAADLATGEERVLASGDLARAVRASMAVPGVFAPVRWDDAVLVDGGLANNLGISVARALGNAPVLAVDVMRPIAGIEESSALGVGLRAMRLLLGNVRASRDSAELRVLPDIPAVTTEATFPADATPLLDMGLRAALAQLPPSNSEPRARAAGDLTLPPRTIDALRVEGVSGALAELVDRTFRPVLGGYDAARVLHRVEALFATGMFHGVWPRLERDESGRGTLVVHAEPIAPVVLTGAARWDSDVGAGSWAAMRARPRVPAPLELRAALTLERLNRTGSLSGTLSPGVATPWGISLGAHYREQRVRRFDEDHRITSDPRVRRGGAWLALEWRRLRPQQALSLAFRAERVDALEGADGPSYGPFLRFSAFPPTYGLLGVENVIEGEYRTGEDSYGRIHAAGSTAHRRGALQAALVGSLTTIDGDAPLDVLPYLGGLLRLPWLRTGDVHGRTTVIGGVDVAYPLQRSVDGRLRVRSGAAGPDLEALGGARWWSGGEAAVVWRTGIAPVTAGIAGGTGGTWRLNLSAGATW